MRLVLGEKTHDLTTRALVIGVLDAAEPDLRSRAALLAASGADVVEVAGGAGQPELVPDAVRAVSVGGVAVSVVTRRPEVAAAAYAAGAVLGSGSESLLEVSVEAGAAIIVNDHTVRNELADARAGLVELARRAEAAGIRPDRLVVEPSLDRRGLGHVRRLAELGYPLLITTAGPALDRLAGRHDPGDRRSIALAATTLAIIGGCRLVRTDDVRGTRRVADVLAAVLEAR